MTEVAFEPWQVVSKQVRCGVRSREHPSDDVFDGAFEDAVVRRSVRLLGQEARGLEDVVLAAWCGVAVALAGTPIGSEVADAEANSATGRRWRVRLAAGLVPNRAGHFTCRRAQLPRVR